MQFVVSWTVTIWKMGRWRRVVDLCWALIEKEVKWQLSQTDFVIKFWTLIECERCNSICLPALKAEVGQLLQANSIYRSNRHGSLPFLEIYSVFIKMLHLYQAKEFATVVKLHFKIILSVSLLTFRLMGDIYFFIWRQLHTKRHTSENIFVDLFHWSTCTVNMRWHIQCTDGYG